jgi:hypothetical protein
MAKKKDAEVPQETNGEEQLVSETTPTETESEQPTVVENEPVEVAAAEPTVAEIAQVEAAAEVVEPVEVRAEEVKGYMIGNDGNPIIPAGHADNKIVRTDADYAPKREEESE